MKLTIADTVVDIGGPRDLPIATTYQVSDLFDPAKAKGDRSEEVTFPQSINNALLGVMDMSAPLSDRKILPAHIDNGAGVLWSGRAVPARIAKSRQTWQLLGNNATWFDQVKDRSLTDINLGETPEHSAANVVASWDIDAGIPYLYPLADYGNLGDKAQTYDVDLKYILPAVSAKYLMDRIFQNLGLVPKYMGTLGAHLPRLFFLFNRKIEDLQATQDQLDAQAAQFAESSTQSAGVLELGTVLSDPAGTYLAPGSYVPNLDMRADFTVTITLSGVTTLQTRLASITRTAGAVNIASGYFTPPNTGTCTVTFTVENVALAQGTDYQVKITNDFSDTIDTAIVTITPINIAWQEGLSCNIASAVPEMKQSDFLKGIFAAFDCKVDTNISERTVTITPDVQWKKPISDAEDWSGKVDTEEEEPAKVREDIPAFFKFTCAQDDNDLLLNEFVSQYGRGLGDYDKPTTDENGIDTKEVKVPWAATQTGVALEAIVMPRLIDKDQTDPDDVTYGWKPRLVYFAGTIEQTWKLQGVDITKVPNVYFCQKSSTYSDFSLAFASNGGEFDKDAGLVDRLHYARLQSIEFSRIVDCMVHLTDEDVRTLDFARPKMLRIDGSVSAYYLLKVDQYLWGQGVSTPCRFIEAHPHLPQQSKKDFAKPPRTMARR